MNSNWSRDLAVRGVFWRNALDWAVLNIPFYFVPFLILFWTSIFFCVARQARRSLLANLTLVRPGSIRLGNYLRAFWIFRNFAWTLTDSAVFRLLKPEFRYELVGQNFLSQLASAQGAIVLTAHMGSYDFGAAIFARKFRRDLRIVRAPEQDPATAQHLNVAMDEATAGAVKIEYNVESNLPFELLSALRNGEIISILGDRVTDNVSRSAAILFGRKVFLPAGPFVLSLVANAPIHPLFIARIGYRRYRIIAREPIHPPGDGRPRDEALAYLSEHWSRVLEETLANYWSQWFAFKPMPTA